VLDFGSGREVGFGVGVDLGGEGLSVEDGSAVDDGVDGSGGFEVAEVVGAIEEVVVAAGRGVNFVVVEVEVLFGFWDAVFDFDDEVDATAGFCTEEVVDAGSVAIVGEVESGEGFFDAFGAGAFHAAFRGEVAESIGEDGHFDVKFSAVGVGAALGGGEVSLFGFVADGVGGSAAFEKAFDVAGLYDVEAHKVGFLDHGGKDAMLVASVGGDVEAFLGGLVVEEWAEGKVDFGVHEDEVGARVNSSERVFGGVTD